MHILFDLRWMADTVTVKRGIGRISLATLDALAKADDIEISFLGLPNLNTPELNEVLEKYAYREFYIQPEYNPNTPMIYAMQFNHWLKMIFEADSIDLLFDPAPLIPFMLKPHYYAVPYVVVYYDIIFHLFNYNRELHRWYGLNHLIANASGIITISDTSFNDFAESLHNRVPCQNVVKALPPLGFPIATDYDRPRKPYVMSITAEDAHKDPLAIIYALARCSEHIRKTYHVKIGGIMSPIMRADFERLAVLHDVQIEFLNVVNNEQLVELYRDAVMIFHGSKYEGLGMPPIEGALLGTPFVRSNGGALKEVWTFDWLEFEAGNYKDAADCIANLLYIYERGEDDDNYLVTIELQQTAAKAMFAEDYLALIKPVLERAADGW